MRSKCFVYVCFFIMTVGLVLFGVENVADETGLLWTFKTGGPVRSTPVLFSQSVIVGSDSGCLFAIDTNSGKEKWRFEADSSISSDPFLDGNVLYFSTKKGSLYSIDSESSNLNWRFTSEADSLYEGGWDYFVSSPVVAGDTVIFGSGDNFIRALHKVNGKVKWVFDTGAIVRSTPAISGNHVFCGNMEGNMFALDLSNGEEIWKFKTDGNKNFPKGEILFRPLIYKGIVYFGSRDAIFYALQEESGDILWKVNAKGPWYTKAAAFENTIFASSSDGRFVQALDFATGAEKWKFYAEDLVFTQPTVRGGILYFGSHDSYLYAVQAGDGRLLKRYRTEDAVLSSPVVEQGVLYFGGDDGRVYAFRCPSASLYPGSKDFKAVYWDPRRDARANRFLSSEEQKVLLYLKDKGYELLDASRLAGFMKKRIEEGSYGVIVLISVHLPYDVFESAEDEMSLFKRYLNTHNSIVSVQSAAYLVTSKEGEDNIFVPQELPGILGMSFKTIQHAFFYYDSYVSHPTEEGAGLGLPLWWSSGFGIDPAEIDTIFGLDEHGRATAWLKNYGGPEGTGFIRIWGGRNFPEDLSFITNAAESTFRAFEGTEELDPDVENRKRGR